MDQDSFRKLMQTPRTTTPTVLGGGSRPRISLAAPAPKKKTVDPSQPAFKPRVVKKPQDSKYRDRASERRVGDGNDYAQVEAVLEDFEKKNAGEDKDKVDAQRKYLGGDSDHSILVKGLDFALLEQNKARTVLTSDDLDALDEAYKESSSSFQQPMIPKKRTREDIIKGLKEARGSGKAGSGPVMTKTVQEEARLLEEVKGRGKFKPIGFKPIASATEGKKKKKSKTADGEQKKKKRKVEAEGTSESKDNIAGTSMPPPPVPLNFTLPPQESEEPFDDDFDIFAGAGEYEGLDFDEDDKDEVAVPKPSKDIQEDLHANVNRRWIATDDEPGQIPQQSMLSSSVSSTSIQPDRSQISPPTEPITSDDEDSDGDRPMRLVPLSSSAIPSIKDLLAMDKAAGSQAKNRKRKDKKKAGEGDDDETKKKTTEEKVDRDYKRLKTYTDKKAAAESK